MVSFSVATFPSQRVSSATTVVLIAVASSALAVLFGGLRGLPFPLLLMEILPGDGSPYLLLLDSDVPSVSFLDSPFLYTYIYKTRLPSALCTYRLTWLSSQILLLP